MTVAHNIEALMKAKGLNAHEVARRMGRNPTVVYDILSGKSRSPKIETLGKIATALGVPLPILFEDSPDEDLRAEMAALFAELSPTERQRLVQTARAWLSPA